MTGMIPQNVMEAAPRHRVRIRQPSDVVSVREQARAFALSLDFTTTDSVAMAACVSEIAREIIHEELPGSVVLRGRDGSFCVEADLSALPAVRSISSLERVMDEHRFMYVAEHRWRLLAVRHKR